MPYIMPITDLMTDLARTPAECYVYRKRYIQTPALQRSAMYRERHTAPLERKHQVNALL